MSELLRQRSLQEHTPNPLKQEAVALAVGIDQGTLSKWLSGRTKTIQKAGAWEKLVDVLCGARDALPEEGWYDKPHLYCGPDNIWRNLDFKHESLWDRVINRELKVACDHRCVRCHGLTPEKGTYCMHCGAKVTPRSLDHDMNEFLLEGDSWAIDIDDHTRGPVG